MSIRAKFGIAVFFALCGAGGWWLAWTEHLHRPVFTEHELAIQRQTATLRVWAAKTLQEADRVAIVRRYSVGPKRLVIDDPVLVKQLIAALKESSYEEVPPALWIAEPDYILCQGARELCSFEQAGKVLRISELRSRDFIVSQHVIDILLAMAKRDA